MPEQDFSQNNPSPSEFKIVNKPYEIAERDLPRHLIEYKKRIQFENAMLDSLKQGENIFVGIVAPPNSGKTTRLKMLQSQFAEFMKQQSGEEAPDPSIVLTYEGSETEAENYILLQDIPDTKIYGSEGKVIFDRRSEYRVPEISDSERRDRAIDPKVEKESNIDLQIQALHAFRTLHKDPAKRVIIFDGPGRFGKHNYGQDLLDFIIAIRPYIQSSPKKIFLWCLLGDDGMYKIAPYERDQVVNRQLEEGQQSWRTNDYGGASAKRIHELFFDEIEVVDEETGELRKGTYQELIIQEAKKYPESRKPSIERAIQEVREHPDNFTKTLHQIDKIRIKGGIREQIAKLPPKYRDIHLFFEFVRYSPRKKRINPARSK